MNAKPISYEYNAQLAKEGAGSTGGRINESGQYVGKITKAKSVTSDKGTSGIELDFETDDKQSAKFMTLWTKNASGESIYGEKQLHALMACLRAPSLTPRPAKIKEYDLASGQEHEVDAIVYPELMNKPIGLVLQKELYSKNNGGDGERMDFFCPFDAKTNQLADELINKEGAVKLAKIVAGLKDKDSRRRGASSSAGVPVGNNPPIDAYYNDMNF